MPYYAENIDDYAFFNCQLTLTNKDRLFPKGIKYVGEGAFWHCYPHNSDWSAIDWSGREVTFDAITHIGAHAFERSYFVFSPVFPDTLEYIGENAFYDITGIAGELVIPRSVQTIEG